MNYPKEYCLLKNRSCIAPKNILDAKQIEDIQYGNTTSFFEDSYFFGIIYVGG